MLLTNLGSTILQWYMFKDFYLWFRITTTEQNVDFKVVEGLQIWVSLQCLACNNPTDTCLTLGRRQSKRYQHSTNADLKSIETVFSIAICRHTINIRRTRIKNRIETVFSIAGDKWLSKTLFLSIFDPRLSNVDSVLDCRLPGVLLKITPMTLLNSIVHLLIYNCIDQREVELASRKQDLSSTFGRF